MYVDTREPVAELGYETGPKMKALREAYPTPSLKGLAEILRQPELWPEDFSWNFRYHPDCAMGLAVRIWPQAYADSGCLIARMLGITPSTQISIFCQGLFIIGSQSWVRPVTVARRIERHLRFGFYGVSPL